MYFFAQNKNVWIIIILIGLTLVFNIINTFSYIVYINYNNNSNNSEQNFLRSINQINKIIDIITNIPIVRSKSIIINHIANNSLNENVDN